MKHTQREKSGTAKAEAAVHIFEIFAYLQTLGQNKWAFPIVLSAPLRGRKQLLILS